MLNINRIILNGLLLFVFQCVQHAEAATTATFEHTYCIHVDMNLLRASNKHALQSVLPTSYNTLTTLNGVSQSFN